MKNLLIKIINFGIKKDNPENVIEKMKLVNGFSLLGVPVCLFYFIMFLTTGYFKVAYFFLPGLLVFSLPILINAAFGLRFSRPLLALTAPLLFGVVTVACGRDTGFYLGFLVISIPPMLFFSKIRSSLFYLGFNVVILSLSIAASMYIPPIDTISYSMAVYLINLFIALFTSIGIVLLFKIELGESRAKIQEKNREILDSINYAYRIQNAILPPESYMKKYFTDLFLLYLPKDIVAGDFYWMETISPAPNSTTIYIAAADCTGHGVPGALVSVVCSNALNRAVMEFGISDPGKILDKTRELVLETFSKSDTEVKDGMDISLCSITKMEKEELTEVKWSGANNPLWYISEGKMNELKPDKQAIGKTDDATPFTTHTISVKKGDTFYLFTDGFADQFGGKKGKKFKYKPLKEILLQNSNLSPLQQKEKLEIAFEEWKGNLEQVDDVCIMGVRL